MQLHLRTARLKALGPVLDGLTVWLLVACFEVVDGVGAQFLAEPTWVLRAVLAVCAVDAQ